MKANKTIIALVLGFLVVAGGMVSAGCSSTDTQTTEETNEGNVFVQEETEDGISIKVAKAYSNEVGVSAANTEYESAYAITAEVNDYSMDRTITWSLSWSSTSDISDYVSLSAETSEAGSEIYLYCYGAFGTQITLTATCGELTATCAIDYAARIEGFNLRIHGVVDVDSSWSIYCTSGDTSEWLSDGNYGLAQGAAVYAEDLSTIYTQYVMFIGTGTKADSLDEEDLVITFADDVKEEIEKSLGLSNASFSLVDSGILDSTLLYADDIFNAFFGSNVMSNDEYKAKVYNALIDYYTAGTAIFKITLTGTGCYTNTDYSFDAWATFNPSAYYVSASSLTLSTEEVCF